MNCGNEQCDGEWISEPPLQDGGWVSVRQCPVCAATAKREAEECERCPCGYPMPCNTRVPVQFCRLT